MVFLRHLIDLVQLEALLEKSVLTFECEEGDLCFDFDALFCDHVYRSPDFRPPPS